MNEFKRMQQLAGLITEAQAEGSYSTKRTNLKDLQIAPGIVNHYFDTIDIIPLDNGNKVQITTTEWYIDNSNEIRTSEAKAVLLDPSGKKLSSIKNKDRFELALGKEFFIPQLIASLKKK
jgi:hypothetical protein